MVLWKLSRMARCPEHLSAPTRLWGKFKIKPGAVGDRVLSDIAGHYYSGFSVEFRPVTCVRDPHSGVRQVLCADLIGAAIVGTGAYAGATFDNLDNLDADAGRELVAARSAAPRRPYVGWYREKPTPTSTRRASRG